MVGLDAAGKTTILYKLKLGEGKLRDTLSWTTRVFVNAIARLPFQVIC